MNKEQLKETNPKIYKFFSRAMELNRLPHALLLHGTPNSNLLDIALFLAKSINCSSHSFACDHCENCTKFDKGIHPDFMLIDGNVDTIKKEQIDKLQEKFSLSSTEVNHVIVYILSEVNNITEEASNALLKFLEEPKTNVVALLTSSNINKVLSTIVSRSVPLFVNSNTIILYKELNNIPLQNFNVEQKDIIKVNFVLSNLFGSKSSVEQFLKEEKDLVNIINSVQKFVKAIEKNKLDEASFILLNDFVQYKTFKVYNLIYRVMSIILKESITYDGELAKQNIFNFNKNEILKHEQEIIQINNILLDALNKSQANLNFIGVLSQICRILII